MLTVIDYEDPALGRRATRLVAVVDPEGFVYEAREGRQLRIDEALVTIYWQDGSGQFVIWPAGDYLQENPQLTNQSGNYSFLVPPGRYYLTVEAKGYREFRGEPFTVQSGRGIHQNLALTPTGGWWRKWLSWPSALTVLVLLGLAYHLYRDRIKEKLINNL